MDLPDTQYVTFVRVLKALLKHSQEHGEKRVLVDKIAALLDHYNL